MTQRHSKSVVVITGASGGLGGELVTQFFSAGWQVVATSRTPAVSSNEQIATLPLDVTSRAQVDETFAQIVQRFGRIDALINNAGLTTDALCAQLEDDDWQRVLNVNLRGAFLCSSAASRHLIRQRDGHIINVSSYAGRAGAAGQSNYAAAKAGLFGLTQTLAKELGGRNIRVNAVLPGVLPTKMTAQLPPERLAAFAAANTLGRINELDEVARFIQFLATTRNISGQLFQLDSRIGPWT